MTFMYLKVAICDDDAKELLTLQQYMQKYELEFDIDFKISLFTSGEKMLLEYNGAGSFDLIFLGIEMSRMNGLETANKIRSTGDYNVKIIFLSNSNRYMLDSFDVQAFHYWQKPLIYSAFCSLMKQIITFYQQTHTIKFLLHQDGTEELVHINDIMYVEVVKEKKGVLRFVLAGREICCKGVLRNLQKELRNYHFVTPYRGFLINLKYVHCINNSFVILTDGKKIPLSRRCSSEIRNLLSSNILIFHN